MITTSKVLVWFLCVIIVLPIVWCQNNGRDSNITASPSLQSTINPIENALTTTLITNDEDAHAPNDYSTIATEMMADTHSQGLTPIVTENAMWSDESDSINVNESISTVISNGEIYRLIIIATTIIVVLIGCTCIVCLFVGYKLYDTNKLIKQFFYGNDRLNSNKTNCDTNTQHVPKYKTVKVNNNGLYLENANSNSIYTQENSNWYSNNNNSSMQFIPSVANPNSDSNNLDIINQNIVLPDLPTLENNNNNHSNGQSKCSNNTSKESISNDNNNRNSVFNYINYGNNDNKTKIDGNTNMNNKTIGKKKNNGKNDNNDNNDESEDCSSEGNNDDATIDTVLIENENENENRKNEKNENYNKNMKKNDSNEDILIEISNDDGNESRVSDLFGTHCTSDENIDMNHIDDNINDKQLQLQQQRDMEKR